MWQLGDQEQKRLNSLASRLAPDPAEARRPAAGGEHGSTVSQLAALDALMSERIVVLDGAWGTMIQARGLAPEDYRGTRFADHERDVAGDPDVLNLTRPDVVSEIHRAYLAAGADVTTTNTFTATRIGQADYGTGGGRPRDERRGRAPRARGLRRGRHARAPALRRPARSAR